MFCPVCGTEMPDNSVFCAVCGTRLTEEPAEPETAVSIEEPKENKCPVCGAVLPEGALFCAVCGNRVAAETEEEPVSEEIPVIAEQEEIAEEVIKETAEEPVTEEVPETAVTTEEPEETPAQVTVEPAEEVKEPVKTGTICPHCGTELPEGALFCAVCGNRIAPETEAKPVTEKEPEPVIVKAAEEPQAPVQSEPEPVCPKCGTKLPKGASFCNNCGYNLKTGKPAGKAAPTIKLPPVDLKKFAVVKDMIIHPDRDIEANLPVCIATLIGGIVINSLTLRNFYILIFNIVVNTAKKFGVSAKGSEIRAAKREMLKLLSGGKTFLWGILITVILFVLITLISMLINRRKEEKTDIIKHLTTAARIMFAPLVLLLLALIMSFVPGISCFLMFIGFMLFMVLIIDLLKNVHIWPRTLLFVLIAFAVLCLFGKGFASAGGEIIEELINELDLDDLLYYLM